MSNPETPRPHQPAFSVWWQAARPRTLPAVLGPMLLGHALVEPVVFSSAVAVAYVLWALSLQVAVNLANDLFDGLSGVDRDDRLGPVRALQAGLLSAAALRRGLLCCLAVSMLLGLWLSIYGHWLMALLSLAALLAALGYSGGRRRSQLVYALMTLLPLALSPPIGAAAMPAWLAWAGWPGLLLGALGLNRAIALRDGAALNPLLGWTALYSLALGVWLSVPHWGGTG
jgi:4-hydroxybenzoate polyprenyltransferase